MPVQTAGSKYGLKRVSYLTPSNILTIDVTICSCNRKRKYFGDGGKFIVREKRDKTDLAMWQSDGQRTNYWRDIETEFGHWHGRSKTPCKQVVVVEPQARRVWSKCSVHRRLSPIVWRITSIGIIREIGQHNIRNNNKRVNGRLDRFQSEWCGLHSTAPPSAASA